MRQRYLKAKLKAEQGFTMVIVIGVMLVGTLLVAAAFASSDGDTTITRHDQYYKQAYDAAEAGIAYYQAHLNQNTNYWSNCYTAPVYAPGTAYSTATSQAIPGSEARYEMELLKAPGNAATCSSTTSSTVIDPSTGQLAIRSTGYYRGVRRSVIGTFKRQGFLNYLWFTNFETPDPTSAGTSSSCAKYHRDGRNSNCGDQQFINGDQINGPMHTNDEFYTCGTPAFGRVGKSDSIEATDPAGYRTCGGSSPTFNGTRTWGAGSLDLPTSNGSLQSYADSTWVFNGPVHITLQSTGVLVQTITSKSTSPFYTVTTLKPGTTFPPGGVIYVKNGTCGTDFGDSQDYPFATGCGDAWVKSSGDYANDVTVAAENDVIIDGSLTHNDSSVIGLIANGFVRVYHPCSGGNNQSSSTADPLTGYLASPDIEAAILSLNHSFMVDNYGCGDPMGNLSITGAIAQEFRGTVGTNSNGTISTGYIKNYNYDPALKYHQPPYFLDPVSASWNLFYQTEQVPAH
jgi:Tfp pilus assembly protein PilX